ncbi:MAG: RNA polymerase sigma factor [Lachnospiraceae bacterium]|nr:RNA polymerase sigma factor [Lachnospiraceae bacterium]
MTEAEFNACIREILQGDRQGLKKIYDAYLDYVYRIVFGVLGQKEDSEDITSELFIKLWQQADRYKPGSGHKAYLTTIARNMAIDHIRKHKREVLESFTKESDDSPVTEPVSNETTEETVIENISVREAIEQLNPAEQQVVNMKVLSEMTFAEIAEVLKAPMGTITWRYREAMKKLRRYGYYEES